jgi:hypothetical protein
MESLVEKLFAVFDLFYIYNLFEMQYEGYTKCDYFGAG